MKERKGIHIGMLLSRHSEYRNAHNEPAPVPEVEVEAPVVTEPKPAQEPKAEPEKKIKSK